MALARAAARPPSCGQAQADGVPCDSVDSDCEHCRRAAAAPALLPGAGRPV